MKKILTTVFALFLSTVLINAQGIEFGLKGGFGASAVGTQDVVLPSQEGKAGIVAGGLMNIDLLLIDLRAELLYTQKGFAFEEAGNTIDASLTYLSVPVLARFNIFPVLVKPYIGAGIEYSTLLDVGSDFDKDDFSSSDFSLVANAGVDFALEVIKLEADLRYVYGLTNIIADPIGDAKITNNSLQLTVGIIF
jgi:opacity protein-like surface antigen